MYKISYVFCDNPARLTREVELLCTNVSDLPDIAEVTRKGFESGSTAYVTKTKQKFILNNENEWDECCDAASSSSGSGSINTGYTKKEVDTKFSAMSTDIEKNADDINTNKTDILSVSAEVNAVNLRVDGVNQRIDNYITHTKVPYDFTVTSKSLINATTGKVSSYNDENYTTATFDVTGISSLYITASANFGNFVYTIFNSNDERIGGSKAANTSAGTVKQDFLLELPDGAVTLIVANKKSATNPQAIELYQMQDGLLASSLSDGLQKEIENKIKTEIEAKTIGKWTDKKWVCIGDSLTEVNSRTTKHYYDYVSEATGISVVNKGVSGTGYMRKYDENIAFYQRASTIPTDADVVTIFGSGNDLSLISVLGEPTDTGTDTICGCINQTIDVIIGLIPDVSLGIVSPTPWNNNKPTVDDSNSMAQYTEALRKICKIRSIPFLNLYHCSNLRPWTAEGRNTCYTKDGGDGVHPDETGHKLIAPRFKNFLESLII